MSYTVEKLEKSKIKFSYVVDKKTYDDAEMSAYQKTKHKYNIPGFRKGHAPKKVIEGMYGNIFFSDAVNDLIDSSIAELEKSGEYRFVAFDSVDKVDITEEGGVSFELVMVLRPDVKLGEYKGLQVERKTVKITSKQVEDHIAQEREKQARLVDVDREAKIGDTVNIDYVGTRDGVPFEGGSAEGYDLELGSGTFIPGFEEQLVGVKAGEERVVNVSFPEDYHAEELAGKAVQFACTVHGVKEKELPALDDDFAKEISEFDTLAEYKEDVKKHLTEHAEEEAEKEYENEMIKAIVEGSEVEIPEVMIEQEQDDIVSDFEHRLYHQGLSAEDYYKYTGTTREDVKTQYKESAERQVRVRLVLEEIVKAENVDFTEEELDKKVEEFAEQSGLSAEEFKKTLSGEQITYIANVVVYDKLIALLKSYNPPVKKAKKAAKPEEAKAEEKAEEVKEEAKEAQTEKPKKKAPAKKSAKKAEEAPVDAE